MNKKHNEIHAEINALNQLLAASDYKAIKHSEGEISDEDYEPTRAKRHEWRQRIRALSAQLEAEG